MGYKKGKEKDEGLPGKAEIEKMIAAAGADDVETLFEIGVLSGQKGDHEAAEKIFHRIIQINPNYADAWYNKGISLGKFGRYEEAIKCCDEVIRINSNYAEAWSSKGVSLERLGKPGESIKCFDEAIRINPNFEEAWSNKGVSFERLGRNEEAVKCCDEAIRINPNYAMAWSNKGVSLVNLGRYEEAAKCCDKALSISPNDAVAYGNRGISFIVSRRYEEAVNDLEKAESLFSKSGKKNEAGKVQGLKKLAENAATLMGGLDLLDEKFKGCLGSRSLSELRDEGLKLAEDANKISKEFAEKDLPDDARELLKSKLDCFTAPSRAMRFEKIDLEKLEAAKKVFEKWSDLEGVVAVNSLDNFIRLLGQYESFEKIPKEKEGYLLIVLGGTLALDGDLTGKIAEQFKGEPFAAKPTVIEERKRPKIALTPVENVTGGERWVRVCLIQLDFSLTARFPYALKNKEKVKAKVFGALEVAQKEKADVICFPELSFEEGWVEEIGKSDVCKDRIIVCGSYYDGNRRNICPIIINGRPYLYAKCHCAMMERGLSGGPDDKSRMIEGDKIFVFATKWGKAAVLTCVDFDDEHWRIKEEKVNLIINPRYDIDKEHTFQKLMRIDETDGSRCPAFVLQVNPKKTVFGESAGGGGTCVIGNEHPYQITHYKNEGLRPKDDVKYKIFEAKGETILIADLRLDETTKQRTKPGKQWYKYNKGRWEGFDYRGIW
jgi:tetratricopeptide (TPR) repeat protein/predicted amidohydrolase